MICIYHKDSTTYYSTLAPSPAQERDTDLTIWSVSADLITEWNRRRQCWEVRLHAGARERFIYVGPPKESWFSVAWRDPLLYTPHDPERDTLRITSGVDPDNGHLAYEHRVDFYYLDGSWLPVEQIETVAA